MTLTFARDFLGECLSWHWVGYLDRAGYGRFSFQRKMWLAHRWALTQWQGCPLGEGQVDHVCHNRRCVYPGHLELVSPLVNTHRALDHAQELKTHCSKGHPVDRTRAYSTDIEPRGRRRQDRLGVQRDRARLQAFETLFEPLESLISWARVPVLVR